MRLDTNGAVGGVPQRVVRDVLKRVRRYTVVTRHHIAVAASPAYTVDQITTALESAGLLLRAWPDHEAPWEAAPIWVPTTDGLRFAAARLRTIKRATADRIIQHALDQVATMNADDSPFPYRVARIRVFGSYLTDAPEIGDIDLCVELIARSDHPTPQFNDMRNADRAMIKALFGGTKTISLIDPNQLAALHTTTKTLFADPQLVALLPVPAEAEIAQELAAAWTDDMAAMHALARAGTPVPEVLVDALLTLQSGLQRMPITVLRLLPLARAWRVSHAEPHGDSDAVLDAAAAAQRLVPRLAKLATALFTTGAANSWGNACVLASAALDLVQQLTLPEVVAVLTAQGMARYGLTAPDTTTTRTAQDRVMAMLLAYAAGASQDADDVPLRRWAVDAAQQIVSGWDSAAVPHEASSAQTLAVRAATDLGQHAAESQPELAALAEACAVRLLQTMPWDAAGRCAPRFGSNDYFDDSEGWLARHIITGGPADPRWPDRSWMTALAAGVKALHADDTAQLTQAAQRLRRVLDCPARYTLAMVLAAWARMWRHDLPEQELIDQTLLRNHRPGPLHYHPPFLVLVAASWIEVNAQRRSGAVDDETWEAYGAVVRHLERVYDDATGLIAWVCGAVMNDSTAVAESYGGMR